MPESLEQFDLLLLTVPKTRVIHQDEIRFSQRPDQIGVKISFKSRI
jgi:hypothetical protein